jgi:hypothetical protein
MNDLPDSELQSDMGRGHALSRPACLIPNTYEKQYGALSTAKSGWSKFNWNR